MRNLSILLLAILVLPVLATSQLTVRPWEPPPPGILESFLSTTPNARIVRKLLGVLGGQASPKATFTAIVAEDPARPGAKAKGIEIEMEDGNRKLKVYLDDDRSPNPLFESLREFASSIDRLAQNPPKQTSNGQRDQFGVIFYGSVGAQNRAAVNPEYCCPRYAALNVGWCGRDGELGVHIDDAGKTHSGFWLNFPGVKPSRVAEFLRAGKDWLDLN